MLRRMRSAHTWSAEGSLKLASNCQYCVLIIILENLSCFICNNVITKTIIGQNV